MSLLIPHRGIRLAYALQSRAFATALAIAVYQLTGSSLAMGFFLTAQIIPELLFTLFGGVAADRLPRRLVLLGADTGRALTVIMIALLAALKLLHLWHLFVLAILSGLARSFFGPAYRAITPELVAKEHLASANALTSMSIQFGNFLGPVLGAGFIVLGGGSASAAFAFDGFTFVISVCSLLAIRSLPLATLERSSEETKQPDGLRSMAQDVGEGFRTIVASTWLSWSLIVATFGLVAYTGAMAVALPKMVFAVYASGPWLLAAITTTTGIGAMAGAIFVGQVPLRRRGIIAFLGYILSGLALIVFSLPLPRGSAPYVAVPAAFAVGFGMYIMHTIWATLLYELVPNEKLGRVSSVDLLGSLGLLPLGYVLAGLLSDRFGPPAVFLYGGLLMVILDIIPLFLRDIRKLQ